MPTRVLIVDDDARFRALARALLQAAGCEVVAEAATGAQALAAVDTARPDAAVVDVQLPDTDGVSLAQSLAGHDGTLRVVLTSTDPTLVPPAALTQSGAVAFVGKEDIGAADLAGLLDR
jgi:DNA-binding NarL/FixJ family response regulator